MSFVSSSSGVVCSASDRALVNSQGECFGSTRGWKWEFKLHKYIHMEPVSVDAEVALKRYPEIYRGCRYG